MIAAKSIDALDTFMKSNFNTYVAQIAAEWEKTIAGVTEFMFGYTDPYSLMTYNAAMLIPDQGVPDKEQALMIMPVDFLFAIRAEDPKTVLQHQLAYQDAFFELLLENPDLGGGAWEAEFNSVDHFAPMSGNLQIGVTVISINISQSYLGRV